MDWTQTDIDEANANFRKIVIHTRYRLDPDNPGQCLTTDRDGIGEEPMEASDEQ